MHVFCELAKLLRRLHRKLSRRAKDHALKPSVLFIYLLQHRDAKSSRLSGSRLRLSYHIFSFQKYRYRLFLNRRHVDKSHLLHRAQNPFVDS